jgi:hypothetical protein
MFSKIIAILASVSLVASQDISATEDLVSAAATYRALALAADSVTYKMFTTKRTWHAAEAACKKWGGRLAVI